MCRFFLAKQFRLAPHYLRLIVRPLLPPLFSPSSFSHPFSSYFPLYLSPTLSLPAADPSPLLRNLILNDVINAKLLWQRIPSKVKSEDSELKSVWQIGLKMWTSDFPAAFAHITDNEWSSNLEVCSGGKCRLECACVEGEKGAGLH